MKIDLNDPRITAFALGELTGNDAREIARALRTDPGVRKAVDEARDTSRLLLETFGGGEADVLTFGQREAVRSVGTSSVSADMGSPKVSFWKKPAVAGIGVAAAVVMTLYLMIGRPGGGDSTVVDTLPQWDWSEVNLEDLTAPSAAGPSSGGSDAGNSEAVRAVSAAMNTAISDDTTSFRKEIKKRIEQSDLKSVAELPELVDAGWLNVTASQSLEVPLAAGAASWPWIQRYIEDQNTLPPRQAVRIEEMVNHFRYKKPTMLSSGGLVADMELCRAPWNPDTLLLALHISSDANVGVETGKVSVTVNAERVARIRLLGYSHVKSASVNGAFSHGPNLLSRSHGNYVIYELEPAEDSDSRVGVDENAPFATLSLGDNVRLPVGRAASWINASPDLRFASTVTATGMLLAGTPSAGELDTSRLRSFVDLLEKQDAGTLVSDRRDALKLIRKTAAIIDTPIDG